MTARLIREARAWASVLARDDCTGEAAVVMRGLVNALEQAEKERDEAHQTILATLDGLLAMALFEFEEADRSDDEGAPVAVSRFHATLGQGFARAASYAEGNAREFLPPGLVVAWEKRRANEGEPISGSGAGDAPDYSSAYQDEYQRLWHEAAAERDRLRAENERLQDRVTTLEERLRHEAAESESA